jgi:hypothetical protein
MPFTKGSPNINRNGRPRKGQTVTDAINSVIGEKVVNFKGHLISGKEAVARKLLELAISGDVPAIKYLMDRIDGPPRQEISISGDLGTPVEFVFVDPPQKHADTE